MVHCKTPIAAMQTDALLVASGIHKVVSDHEAVSPQLRKGDMMSKTASIALNPSSTLFGRFLAAIDRLLMTSARIAVRNGDLPRFGL
jgi:hypothetical protein